MLVIRRTSCVFCGARLGPAVYCPCASERRTRWLLKVLEQLASFSRFSCCNCTGCEYETDIVFLFFFTHIRTNLVLLLSLPLFAAVRQFYALGWNSVAHGFVTRGLPGHCSELAGIVGEKC
ncbi:uncharacterized protein BO97DRAFT_186972 [Aspergillus homomorphus CBS 101889]|uniref:Uncharacterized protein n=1 Tax=Aspergillus homomorphus (strain CBS 101889) TaxID=1450537 RepID=A0A395HN69_ASPHC|nr:hypothetical protein BO97DRAFT_186972 [Aspergillus homomorphus CBS 101889]RAL09210.1 hypothetical protein BO97DRAFT_186972 [Aspergillus homomorphus CBS 101889]